MNPCRLPTRHPRGWPAAIKSGLDRVAAALGLLLAAPLLAAIAIAVRLSMGRPVLYRQARPGLHGRSFRIVKFRTMTEARDADVGLLPDADRLTRLGRFLRETSLDELPQLWNVVAGDMSLVGPRPLLPEYLTRYSPEELRRHCVRPGITGWAQVNGRNALSWEEKLGFDVWYVDHWSLRLDLAILGTTVARTLLRRDVSAVGHATMPEFRPEHRP